MAHEPWLEAAVIANDNGDPDRMYEALRGYVQMIRVRPPDEFRDLVDNLLQLLPPGDSSLRAAALGWRAVPWMGGDLSTLTPGDQRMADEAVAMARRLGDATALGSALRSRLSSAEYGAGDLQRILEDARELVALRAAHGADLTIETAGELRDLARVLIRLGRTADAERYLRVAREEAERSGERLAMNAALIIESALASARGQFGDAKRIAAEAAMYAGNSRLVQLRFGAQVVAVRLEEGRLEEVIAALENIDSLGVTVPEWRAMLVTALAQAQRRDEAIAVLHDLDDAELFSSGRPTAPLAVRHVAEACRLLGDATRAASALTFVRPWSGQVLLVLPGASIEGAGDRSVGHLLAVLGRLDEADAAYSAAAQLERAAGFPPLAARTEYWHARALLERCGPGDHERADQLLADVAEITQRLGMHLLHQQAQELAIDPTFASR